MRFALGFSAVAIAAFTFYADRRLGWEATTSPWIISAVVAYFAINSVFTVWVWGVEAGEVFCGRRRSGEMVCLTSFSSARCANGDADGVDHDTLFCEEVLPAVQDPGRVP